MDSQKNFNKQYCFGTLRVSLCSEYLMDNCKMFYGASFYDIVLEHYT